MMLRSTDLQPLSTNTQSLTPPPINSLDIASYTSSSAIAQATPPDIAGDTPLTALDLGILSNQTIRDFVGSGDAGDLYRFQMDYDITRIDGLVGVDFVLNGLSADADIRLFQDANQDGQLDANEQLRSSLKAGSSTDQISIAALYRGEYYLSVRPYQSSSTPYSLSITRAFSEAGSTIATAAEVGIISGRKFLDGEVDNRTDQRDLYSIRLNNPSDLTLNLTGLSSDADLRVYRDSNSDGVLDATELLRSSALSGSQNEQITLTNLSAGSYFVSVDKYNTSSDRPNTSTKFELTITSDAAGSTLSTARNLGNLSASQTITDFVGGSDPTDIYRFQLTNNSNVQLKLDNLLEDADLTLVRDINANGTIEASEILGSSILSGRQDDTIGLNNLLAGSYFVFVNRGLTTANTNYRLNLAANAVSNLQQFEGDLSANTFRPSTTVNRTVISGNGNVQFGQGIFDNIDLSSINSTSINLNLAGLSQGGVAYNPGNGTRIFDAITFTDGRQILFEGIDTITFADRTVNLAVPTNDPLFRNQWSLHAMGVQNAWRFTTGNDRVLVGVGDSGLSLDRQDNIHPDLQPSIVFSNNYADDFEDAPADPIAHGTSIQSIIAATSNNGIGLSGINWNSPIVSIDVLGGDYQDQTLAEATQTMINQRRPGQRLVINLSLSSPAGVRPAFEALVSQYQNEVLFVIASGNDSSSQLADPASLANRYGNVIAVGAVDRQANHFDYSNYGRGLTISAPSDVVAADGSLIGNTVRFDYTNRSGGTSSATPNVTGVASLVWSANPNLTAAQVREVIASTAYDLGNPGYDTLYGAGFVNADAAIRRAIALA
jgi:serine protease